MKLVVAGCSHSNGSEIDGVRHPGNPHKAYGGKIAKHYGWDMMNISGPGWGNDWIFDSTMAYFEKISDPENHFALIGWTCPGRYTLYCHVEDKVVHVCPGQDASCFTEPSLFRRVDQHYKTAMLNEHTWRHEHYMIIAMQDFLKKIGVNYLFFDAVTANHALGLREFNLENIDKERYFRLNDEQNSYWNYYLQNIWDGNNRWSQHAPESYHDYWAGLLIEYIEENKLWPTST
jgi:hypothetical protein